MVDGNLDTTNLLLGVLAAVAVLEALVLVGVGVMAWKLYARTLKVVEEIEQRHIAPLTARVHTLMTSVDGVLADVKGITARVTAQSERVDTAIRTTIDRVDETADRVRTSVSSRVSSVLGMVNALRAAANSFFNGHTRRTSGAAPGHA